jgi:hypothetical protein
MSCTPLLGQQTITRDELKKNGFPPRDVAEEMNRLLAGQVVHCDGGDYDQHWCDRLFKQANKKKEFRLAGSDTLFQQNLKLPKTLQEGIQSTPVDPLRIKLKLDALKAEAWSINQGQRHRADVDVNYLITLWKLVQQHNLTHDEYTY